MATIVDCPSCNRKLRVPDDLLGKKVKCPTCGGTFDAVAGPGAVPKLELGNEGSSPMEPSPPSADVLSPPPSSSSETPAESVPPSDQPVPTQPSSEPAAGHDLAPCPYCGEKIAEDATRCQFCGEELTEDDKGRDRPWDREYRPYRDVRRDSEPHRGNLILTLGIVSIVTAWTLGPVGLIIGIFAWVMGQRDLKKMRANVMDPQGMGSTQAGWICGIIGTAFGGITSLCCIAWIGMQVAMFSAMARTPMPSPPPRTAPVVRPAPPPAPVAPAPAPDKKKN